MRIQRDPADVRAHFIQRLKERYNIDITEHEYDRLLKTSKLHFLYRIRKTMSVVFIRIKGTPVLCLYQRKQKTHTITGVQVQARLVTCFTMEQRIPCPGILIKKGYNRENFEKDMNDIIKQVHELSYEFNKVGAKDFFLYNKSNRFLKAAAALWARKFEVKFDLLINYLEYKMFETKILNMIAESV
jgi:hypothetical protein